MGRACKYLEVVGVDNICHQWPDRNKYIANQHRKRYCDNNRLRGCVWLYSVNPGTTVFYESDLGPLLEPAVVETYAEPRDSYSLREMSDMFGLHGREHITTKWITDGYLEAERETERKFGARLNITRQAIIEFVSHPEAWPTYSADAIEDPEIRSLARIVRQGWDPDSIQHGDPRWTPEVANQVAYLRREGMSWQNIADALGVARSVIYRKHNAALKAELDG
jgi:hypothetical protein